MFVFNVPFVQFVCDESISNTKSDSKLIAPPNGRPMTFDAITQAIILAVKACFLSVMDFRL